jgi:hypothetical protein
MTSIAPPARPALESKLRTTLVEAVNASGYTHRQIAERAGLSVSTVAKALCGERAGQIRVEPVGAALRRRDPARPGTRRRPGAAHAAAAPRPLRARRRVRPPGGRQARGAAGDQPRRRPVALDRGTALPRLGGGEAFTGDNLRKGLLRWLTEQRVTPHPEHPGTADLYDAVEQCVDDHKFLGESSMAKIRRGWPRHYLVQLLLYGLGYWLMGLPVRRVVLIAYPRTDANLDGMYVRDTFFTGADGQVLPEVLELLATVFSDTDRRKAQAAEIVAGRIRFEDVPATPDDDTCYFCPFYRPQAARDSGPGCPGAVVPTS